ncbi:MAG: hypothetical protein JO222_15140, partial [Frankiales bacterium]|nr:hypothetical protein [Frankiales bacterium]
AELQQSAQIISQRLTLLHISAKVRVVGDHLAVTHAAALSRHTLAQVVQVGDAQVRRILQVQDEVPPDHTFAPRATTFATLATAMRAWPHQDCRPGLPSATPAHDYVGACDPADSQHFLLGSRSLVRRDFARAVAFTDNNVGLDGVLLTVTHAATAKARAITTSALLRPSPPNCAPPTGCDEVALTLDGVVLAQPRVIAPAPGRMLQFGVQRGSPPAHVLAAILNTPVLPSSFTLA